MEEKIKIRIDPVKYIRDMSRRNNKLKPVKIHSSKRKRNKINIINEREDDDISLLGELDRVHK